MSKKLQKVFKRMKGWNLLGRKKAHDAKDELKRKLDQRKYDRLDKDLHIRPWDTDSLTDSDDGENDSYGYSSHRRNKNVHYDDSRYGDEDLDLRVQSVPPDAFGLDKPRTMSRAISTPGFIDFHTSLRGTFTGSTTSLDYPEAERTQTAFKQRGITTNLKRVSHSRRRKILRRCRSGLRRFRRATWKFLKGAFPPPGTSGQFTGTYMGPPVFIDFTVMAHAIASPVIISADVHKWRRERAVHVR